jgi:hypothetical protein
VNVKALTRRELFSELFSKKTIKQVATAWQGFSEPLLSKRSGEGKKEETLLERVNRLNMKQTINNRKEG